MTALVIAALFTGRHDPDIIKWKEIYETLETAIARCEDVVDILERIVLKNGICCERRTIIQAAWAR